MKSLLITSILMLGCNDVMATEICDFEHQCYPGGAINPDRIIPPPQPQTQPAPQDAHIKAGICHIMLMRRSISSVFEAVEVCSLSPEKEAEIRQQMY